jgi:DNA-directed RNA polymerase specialized sigma24 family protein
LLLGEADVELWEVSYAKLARAVCAAFGLRQRFCELGLAGTFQAGVWSADAVPVILSVYGTREQFRNAVARLCARLRRRFILFAPTATHMDASIEEMLHREQSAFFALEAVATLTPGGSIVAAQAPGELFSAFRPAATEQLDEDTARSAFELVRRLEMSDRLKPPTLVTVFRLYCIDQFSAARIARVSGCAKSTVLERLKLLRQKTGVDPARLRALSSHLARADDSLSDSRAKHIHRRSAAYGEEDESEG